MGKASPEQHPAIVLRSHYQQLRALLAVALIAIVGLTTAVVILATNDGGTTEKSTPVVISPAPSVGTVRYDGGPDEGTRGLSAPRPNVRYDGGPEEGTRGQLTRGQTIAPTPEDVRSDGGPEEGTRGLGH